MCNIIFLGGVSSLIFFSSFKNNELRTIYCLHVLKISMVADHNRILSAKKVNIRRFSPFNACYLFSKVKWQISGWSIKFLFDQRHIIIIAFIRVHIAILFQPHRPLALIISNTHSEQSARYIQHGCNHLREM